jgi:hypothetical protein
MNEKKAKGKSPLEGIKGVKANITTQELVEIIREGREGSEWACSRTWLVLSHALQNAMHFAF